MDKRTGYRYRIKSRLFIDAASFLRLLDQLKQTGNFGFWPAFQQIFKIPIRKLFFEVVHYVKILPPAITDLEAGQGVIAYIQTISEFNWPSKPGAAPFHVKILKFQHLQLLPVHIRLLP